jgi:hypothetical protein
MRRLIVLTVAVTSLALGGVAYAGDGPTPGPVGGPGCFGLWRAGSVQVINDGATGPAGLNYFAERKAENATINADNRATCADLSD